MAFDPNPLFYEMCQIFQDNYTPENKVVICNEGSTRSSKTWDAFHFIYTFCDHNRNKGNDIYILRDTLTNCRDYTFKDFKKCMKVIGAKLKYTAAGQKPYVNIFGNNVYFRGLDSEESTEGYPSDIIFVNEMLETSKQKVIGLKMRCRKLMIADWNPKFTEHWAFDLEGQDNTFFTRTTYKDNKHLQGSVIKDIEAYNPWELGTYYVENGVVMYCDEEVSEKNQPPPNIHNIEKGTADEFRWKVYGLGLRGAMKGLIFPNVRYIDKFPSLAYTYGLDLGFTADPSALVRYAEDKQNIYMELLCYSPTETPYILHDYMEAIGIEKNVPITADSSDRYTNARGSYEFVSELFNLGWEISKVSKTGSIMLHIGTMKEKRINIIKNEFYQEFKKEQENYRLKEINGIAINQPIDGWDHAFSAGRYAHMAHKVGNMEADWG